MWINRLRAQLTNLTYFFPVFLFALLLLGLVRNLGGICAVILVNYNLCNHA